MRGYDPKTPPFDFFVENSIAPLDQDPDIVWILVKGLYHAYRLSTGNRDPLVKPKLFNLETADKTVSMKKKWLTILKRRVSGDTKTQWDDQLPSVNPSTGNVRKPQTWSSASPLVASKVNVATPQFKEDKANQLSHARQPTKSTPDTTPQHEQNCERQEDSPVDVLTVDENINATDSTKLKAASINEHQDVVNTQNPTFQSPAQIIQPTLPQNQDPSPKKRKQDDNKETNTAPEHKRIKTIKAAEKRQGLAATTQTPIQYTNFIHKGNTTTLTTQVPTRCSIPSITPQQPPRSPSHTTQPPPHQPTTATSTSPSKSPSNHIPFSTLLGPDAYIPFKI